MASEPNPYLSPKANLGPAPARQPRYLWNTYSLLYKPALLTGLKIEATLGILSSLVSTAERRSDGSARRWWASAWCC